MLTNLFGFCFFLVSLDFLEKNGEEFWHLQFYIYSYYSCLTNMPNLGIWFLDLYKKIMVMWSVSHAGANHCYARRNH